MKFSIRDSRLVSVGLASVIGVAVIGLGSVALAQDSGDSATPAPSTTTTPETTDSGANPLGRLREGFGKVAGWLRGILDGAGLTPAEIREGKDAGLTWGEILDQYGDISAAEAKANALAKLEEKLTEAVANGRITQERADEILANAPAEIDEFLASVPGDHPRFPRIGGPALETVAEVLGTDVETLKSQLQDGQTIAEIAGDQTQAVIDALVADANEKIDDALANGRITQEQADTMKANTVERITTFVNEGGPLHGLCDSGEGIRERLGDFLGRGGGHGFGGGMFGRGDDSATPSEDGSTETEGTAYIQ